MSERSASPVTLRNFTTGARFFAQLPGYLRHPISVDQARATLAERLRARESAFLSAVRRNIYGYPMSPYLELLNSISCSYSDIEDLVRRHGLEGALRLLFKQGVYLTVDEFKGRKPVVRGSLTLSAGATLLRNPSAAYQLTASSSGSRSSGTPVLIDLRFVAGCAVDCALHLDALGGRDWAKATWEVPGGGARFRLAKFAGFGSPPERWFSQVDPDDPGLHPVFRWNTRAMRWASVVARVPLPKPIFAPLRDPTPVIQWMTETLREGRTPHLFTFPSSAVALSCAATQGGVSLEGARITTAGEPTTEARLATLRQAGCQALPRYGSVECGPIAYSCMNAAHPDEAHLLADLHALIQAGPDNGAGLPPSALLITSLHPYSPFTMLNVSMGDEAVLEEGECGCPTEALGWTRRLHTVRSFEKLTGGGMTFLGADVIRILEETLPSRFGGAPTDYQLCEEESADGQSVLRLLVHPSVGPVDTAAVAETFLSALGSGSVTNRLMEKMWRESSILRVERAAPLSTRSGKVLHLHVLRRLR